MTPQADAGLPGPPTRMTSQADAGLPGLPTRMTHQADAGLPGPPNRMTQAVAGLRRFQDQDHSDDDEEEIEDAHPAPRSLFGRLVNLPFVTFRQFINNFPPQN